MPLAHSPSSSTESHSASSLSSSDTTSRTGSAEEWGTISDVVDRLNSEHKCHSRQSIGERDHSFASPISTQPITDTEAERGDLGVMDDKEHHTIADSIVLSSSADAPPPETVCQKLSPPAKRSGSSISSRTSHHRPVCKLSTKRTEKRINELTADNSMRGIQREPSRWTSSISQDLPLVYTDLPPPNPSINPSISKHAALPCIVELKRRFVAGWCRCSSTRVGSRAKHNDHVLKISGNLVFLNWYSTTLIHQTTPSTAQDFASDVPDLSFDIVRFSDALCRCTSE